jgi:hypothetical protein
MRKKCIAFLLIIGQQISAQQITNFDIITSWLVPQYDKIEYGASINQTYDNPYNPDEVKLQAEFTSPSGQTYLKDAFFYIPFAIDTTKQGCNGSSSYNQRWIQQPNPRPWRIRFAPNEIGLWSVILKLYVNGNSISISNSISQQFYCYQGNNAGFLKRSKNGKYLEFTNGNSFFGIGENITHFPGTQTVKANVSNINGSGCNKTFDATNIVNAPCSLWNHSTYAEYMMKKWMAEFSEVGGNYQRLWITPDGYDPEWETLGNYTNRQNRMYELDQLIEFSKEKNIYIQLMLIHSSRFDICDTIENGWPLNPYRNINGVNNIIDFFTNPTAVKLHKQKLRYIMSRWGYSTNIACYELSNELDFMNSGGSLYTGNCSNKQLVARWWDSNYYLPINQWHIDISQFIKNEDKNHLIMYSNAVAQSMDMPSTNSAVLNKNIDLISLHQYGHDYNINYQKSFVNQKYNQKYKKPINIGETGFNGGGVCSVQDPENTLLHNSLWGSAFNGSFTTDLYYFVQTEHHHPVWGSPLKSHYQFLPLSKFLQGIKFNDKYNNFTPIGNNMSAFESYLPNKFGSVRTNDAPIIDFNGFTPCNWFSGENDPPNVAYLVKDIKTTNDKKIGVYALKKDNLIIGWVHNKDYYFYNTNCSPYGESMTLGCDGGYPPTVSHPNPVFCTQFKNQTQTITPLTNQKMTIKGLVCSGVYRVEWWSTHPFYGDVNTDGIINDNGGKIDSFTKNYVAFSDSIVIDIPQLISKGSAPYAPDYGFKVFLIFGGSNSVGKWVHEDISPQLEDNAKSVSNLSKIVVTNSNVLYRNSNNQLSILNNNNENWTYGERAISGASVSGDFLHIDNKAYIVCSDGWIRFINTNGNNNVSEIVGGNGQPTWKKVAQNSKLAFKNNHLFYKSVSGQVMHYWWNGATFSHESTGNYGANYSHFNNGDLIISDNNEVFYIDVNGWIRMFKNSGSGWTNQIVGGNGQPTWKKVAQNSKLAFKSNHLFYKSVSGQVMHYWWNGATFSHESTGNYGANYSHFNNGDLIISDNNEVFYIDVNGWIRMFKNSGSGWTNQIVGGNGQPTWKKVAQNSKLAFKSNHLFYKSVSGQVMHYWWNGSVFLHESTGNYGSIPSHYSTGDGSFSEDLDYFYIGKNLDIQRFKFHSYQCSETSGKKDELNGKEEEEEEIHFDDQTFSNVEDTNQNNFFCLPTVSNSSIRFYLIIKDANLGHVYNIEIYNSNGLVVDRLKYKYEKDGESIKYNIQNFQSGFYYARVKLLSGVLSAKFIKVNID